MLWGSSYFMNKALVGMMPPGDITAVRFTMSAIVLALVAPRALRMSRRTLLQGIAMGTAYGIAQLFLMFGIVHTSASVSGFLTGMYAVFTAVMVALILRRNPPPRVWISVGLATAALGVLTLAPGATGGLGLGELLSIAAAVGFAAHIVLTDMFIDQRRVMSLAIVQTATVAVWSLAVAAPGGITMPHGTVQWGALIYLGVLCGALTLFLQAWGQARMEASRAADHELRTVVGRRVRRARRPGGPERAHGGRRHAHDGCHLAGGAHSPTAAPHRSTTHRSLLTHGRARA